MSVHTEWANATDKVDLITEDDDFEDAHGTGLDPGKVGLAFAEVLVEGTREELADFARRILAAVADGATVTDAAALDRLSAEAVANYTDWNGGDCVELVCELLVATGRSVEPNLSEED